MFYMENQQGPAVQHRGLCSMSCGSLEWEGSLGKNGYTCMCDSSPEITLLLISSRPIEKKKKSLKFEKTKMPSGLYDIGNENTHF